VRPRIAITPGDPRGVGPEVALAAWAALADDPIAVDTVFVGGGGSVLEAGDRPVPVSAWVPQSCTWDDRSAGALAAEAIEQAVALAMRGEVHAIVTGPVHKPSLHAAGRAFPGHTEMLQDMAGAPAVGMLMAAEDTRLGAPLRVLLATTHIPLSAVPTAISADLLETQARLLEDALRADWGIAAPRLALCAFNPHASDGGLFGDEEARIYAPALDRLRASGVRVEGPIPADTVFQRALAGQFDAVVAPYHDVGMAAFKTVCFGTGVNVTLGLPFVRTSPDHGTAFDLAGTGRADPSSMAEALRLAIRLARNRFDTDRARV
jgi:4-hydroxythreonine-4-phosphate dehydrogenase